MTRNALLVWMMMLSAAPAASLAFRSVDIGDPYPPFCATSFQGTRVCSNSYHDEILIIAFVTPTQTHSQETLVDLQDIYLKNKHKKVSAVGVLSKNNDLKQVSELLNLKRITFPIFLDPDRKIYGSFGVFVYPSTGIFDRDRRLKYYIPGRIINFKKHVEGYIRFLLKEISETDLEKILHPAIDRTEPRYRKAENYYRFARIAFTQGKLDKARKLLESSIQAYDDYAPAQSLYGYLHLQEHAYPLALEKFERALAIDPTLEDARLGKQRCLQYLR